MPKYLFVYHAPMTPAEAAPPTPEQMEAVMGEWNAWAGKVGDGMVDFGTPLAGGTRVTRDGVSPSTRDVAGYSLIEAADVDAALELATHPPAPEHARWLRDRGPRGAGHPRHVSHERPRPAGRGRSALQPCAQADLLRQRARMCARIAAPIDCAACTVGWTPSQDIPAANRSPARMPAAASTNSQPDAGARAWRYSL